MNDLPAPFLKTFPAEQRLGGFWDIWPVPLDADITAITPPDNPARIPECTHLQPALFPDRPYWGAHLRPLNQSAWVYQRHFDAPPEGFRRARLRFDGVDYFASVWLNGVYLGEHEGHFAPFEFDVTDALRPGDNRLTVRVSSPWDPPNPQGSYPSDHVIRGLVKGHYEHGEGVIPPDVNPLGIWRPVWLLLDEGVSLNRIGIRAGADGRVTLAVNTRNATGQPWDGELAISIQADNHDGPGVTHRQTLRLAPGDHTLDLRLDIPSPRPWWPRGHGQPHLYRLTASLNSEDRSIATRSELFGLRDVVLERSPQRFVYRINGEPVAIRGSSYMPGLYLSECTPDALARDVELALNANLNLLRVHVHVSPPELYELCDRAGLLVWQDFELNWVQNPSPAFEARARRLQREMIDQLGNHPSIITWACHNEPTMVFLRRHNLEQHPDPALYADAIAQDPTRPVFISSGQLNDDWQRSGDVHSYFGAIWSHRYTDVYPQRFKINTEFGFEAPAALDTLKAHPQLWEKLSHLEGEIEALWTYQAGLVQFHVEHLRRLRSEGCAGYVHFWLADIVPQVGCGVLDSNRVPKGGYDALKQASQPILPMLEHDGRRLYALWALNDTFDAYPNARLTWTVYDQQHNVRHAGETTLDVPANAAYRVGPAKWPVTRADCARVELALYAADGTLLSANQYAHPLTPLPRPRGYPWKFDRELGMKVFDKPGAPSLADQSGNPLFQRLPLSLREGIAEWALRQHLPTPVVSLLGRITDRLY
jgi:beta-mannosidase